MESTKKKAAVDNDFLEKLVSIEKFNAFELICLCCESFNVDPIIHSLVYDNEVQQEHPITKKLIDGNVLSILACESFIPSMAEQIYYEIVVRDLYYKLKEKELDLKDIFKEWKRQESLGEIHSISMCILIKCDIFLSDDNDSKEIRRLAQSSTRFIKDIQILNRNEFCDKIHELPDQPISREMRRSIGHKI